MMAFNKNGTEIDCSDNINFKAYEMEINSVWKFTQGHLKFEGVPQWKLIHDEIFKYGSYAEGWSLPEATTKCGAVHMLGGYCKTSSEHLAKTFSELPVHKRIRIQANFHFIDSWGGDTAYLRVSEEDDMKDLNYVWTESYDYVSSRNAINVCGRDIGDGKFNVFIDVELAHTHNQIKLLFGSSLEQDSCSASYGISSIRIYVI